MTIGSESRSALRRCAVILSASAVVSSGPASACRIPSVMTNEMPNATEIFPQPKPLQQRQQRHAPTTREARQVAARPATTGGGTGARLDCRACIGLMPPLNGQDLMPLVPFTEQSLRIHLVDPPAAELEREGGQPSS